MAKSLFEIEKDPSKNFDWRLKLRKKAHDSERFQKQLIDACQKDVLFFINAFLFLFEPRPKPKVIPFITWDHQDPVIVGIDEHLGYDDVGIEKARGEGATWLALAVIFRRWMFEELFAAGLVSRNEDAVDRKDDPDSLMWKLDFLIQRLPAWMKPKVRRSYTNHTLVNSGLSSTITGYSATADVASGGRKTVFMMDELSKFPRGPDADAMASTQYVTDSRLLISTPKGADGAYYDAMHEESNMVKFILDWKDNITRNRGLYRVDFQGRVHLVDPENPLPPSYTEDEIRKIHDKLKRRGHDVNGTVRSPWFNTQCLRIGASPQFIAQELERNYGGSESKFFPEAFLRTAKETTREPDQRGAFEYDPYLLEGKFVEAKNGDFKLWRYCDGSKRPFRGEFVIGVDVAAGTGGSFSSNSVAHVACSETCEQVAEFATHTMPPESFARFCVSLCYYFNEAYLVWDATGSTGRQFTNAIVQIGYANCYQRAPDDQLTKRRTTKLGYIYTKESKASVLGMLRNDVIEQKYKIYSRPCVDETAHYLYIGGVLEHRSQRQGDDANHGASHGDLVIGAAMAWAGVCDRPAFRIKEEVEKGGEFGEVPPYGSMAYRFWEAEQRKLREDEEWGDSFSNFEHEWEY